MGCGLAKVRPAPTQAQPTQAPEAAQAQPAPKNHTQTQPAQTQPAQAQPAQTQPTQNPPPPIPSHAQEKREAPITQPAPSTIEPQPGDNSKAENSPVEEFRPSPSPLPTSIPIPPAQESNPADGGLGAEGKEKTSQGHTASETHESLSSTQQENAADKKETKTAANPSETDSQPTEQARPAEKENDESEALKQNTPTSESKTEEPPQASEKESVNPPTEAQSVESKPVDTAPILSPGIIEKRKLQRIISRGDSMKKVPIKPLDTSDLEELIYIRVFLSSTFKDMMEERNALITRTFPELREILENRGITITEVDLRWGITIQESQNGRAITLCLEEISNSQYFVCFLGERYGWIPDRSDPKQYNPELDVSHSWLHDFPDISVTEMEIRYAALNPNPIAKRSFFYYRKSDGRKVEEPPGCAEKQAALKDEIRERFEAKVFASGIELADFVLADIKEGLKIDYPRHHEEIDSVALEHIAHNQFGLSRLEIFHGQQDLIAEMLQYTKQDEQKHPFIVSGPPGMGKSALIAKVHSLVPKEERFVHYIGCSSESVQVEFLILRILRALGITLPSGGDIDVVSGFTQILSKNFKGDKKYVLFIDSINQLEDDASRPFELNWLPKVLPHNLFLVLSCTDDHPALRSAESRHWKSKKIGFPSSTDVDKTIMDCLSRFSKRLVEEQKTILVNAEPCRHPLFLRVAVNELRIFGNFELLTKKIYSIIENPTVTELYGSIIQRWLVDYQSEVYPNIVVDTLCAIAVSRAGLKESELLQYVKVPRVEWFPFFVALKSSLFLQHGRYTFSHQQLREAAYNRFFAASQVNGPSFKKSVHKRLGDYFVSCLPNIDEDEMVEAAYQFSCGELWSDLRAFLIHSDVIDELLTTNWKLEVLQHWRNLDQNGFDPVTEYNSLLENEWNKNRAIRVAKLYTGLGRVHDSIHLYEMILDDEERSILVDRTPVIYNDLATLYKKIGEFQKARKMYELTAEIVKARDDDNKDDMLSTALENLAMVVSETGDHIRSYELYKQSLKIRIDKYGDSHPDVANLYNNLALLLSRQKNYEQAVDYYQKGLEIMESVYGKEHVNVATIQSNIASIYLKTDKLEDALNLFISAYKILSKAFGEENPDVGTIVDNTGAVYRKLGRLNEALEYHKKAIGIFEKTFGTDYHGLSTPLCNLALLMKDVKNYSKAEELYLRALHIDQLKYGMEHENVGSILSNLGTLQMAQAKYAEALEYFRRSYNIRQRLQFTDTSGMVGCMMNMAAMQARLQRNADAIQVYTAVIPKIQALGASSNRDLAVVYHNLGILHFNEQNDTDALEWFRKALDLENALFGPESDEAKETLGYIEELTEPASDGEEN